MQRQITLNVDFSGDTNHFFLYVGPKDWETICDYIRREMLTLGVKVKSGDRFWLTDTKGNEVTASF